jgi:hypothetical protein
MKRTVFALALSLLAVTANAVEQGPPFDQLEIDRALPNIDFPPVESHASDAGAPYDQLAIDRAQANIDFLSVEPYVSDARAPYDQLAIDRALPNLPSAYDQQFAQGPSAGNTLTDATATDEPSTEFTSARDYFKNNPPE